MTPSEDAPAGPVVCCDLDGVLWRGSEPIPGGAGAIARLRDAGVRVGFLSNNSSPTHEDYVAKLGAMGIEADGSEVLSSADAAAALLAEDLEPEARVLVGGGPGVHAALVAVGLTPVALGAATDEDVRAVVVGWHDFDFAGLDRMSRAIRAGARFVATNVDATYPSADGLLPGSGAIVASVATATGLRPEVAGKPEAPTVRLVRDRLGDVGVVVGDRPSTDGALADALGWPYALVLSGVTRHDGGPGRETVPDPPPPFVGEDLAGLVGELVTALGRR